MLLKAEKILSHDDKLLDMSEQELYKFVKFELTTKIVEKMIEDGYVKIEIVHTKDDIFGDQTKIKATTRVYNPDD